MTSGPTSTALSAKFLAAYDDAKAAARVSLGTLYNEDDYPSLSELGSAFSIEVRPQPLPAGHDWRIDLPDDAVERIRLDLETRLEEAQRLATADLYRRLSNRRLAHGRNALDPRQDLPRQPGHQCPRALRCPAVSQHRQRSRSR